MSSTLIDAMNAIQTVWEALTPPSDVGIKFKRIRQLANVGRRTFYFTIATSKSDSEFGANFALKRYLFDAVVRIDGTGLDLVTFPEERANDGVLLENSVQFNPSWPAGVRSVNVTGSKPTPTESGDIDLTISFVALCEESDR